ncbi:MAG: VOC family protein [Gemmataceae bacterium]
MSTATATATATALIPHLVVNDAAAASEFYQAAFGAAEHFRMPEPKGGTRLMHVSLGIGDLKLMLCDDFPEYCGGVSKAPKPGVPTGVTLHLDVPDCDATFEQAIAAGATPVMPPMDAFWGDRYAKLTDPFGHEWSLAHRLTAEQKAAAEKAWAEWQATN